MHTASAHSKTLSRNPEARQIHDLTYFRHATDASEEEIQRAIHLAAGDRQKVERLLERAKPVIDRT